MAFQELSDKQPPVLSFATEVPIIVIAHNKGLKVILPTGEIVIDHNTVVRVMQHSVCNSVIVSIQPGRYISSKQLFWKQISKIFYKPYIKIEFVKIGFIPKRKYISWPKAAFSPDETGGIVLQY